MNLDSLSKKKFSSPILESDQSRNMLCETVVIVVERFEWIYDNLKSFVGDLYVCANVTTIFTRIYYLFILFLLFIYKKFHVFVIPSSIVYISVLYQNINKETVLQISIKRNIWNKYHKNIINNPLDWQIGSASFAFVLTISSRKKFRSLKNMNYFWQTFDTLLLAICI